MNKGLSEYWNNKFKNVNEKYIQPTEFGIKSAEIMKKNGVVSLLELGPGRGRDTFYFDTQDFSITAVDISDDVLKYLDEKTKATVIHSDMRNINFQSESFDAVYARLSLHYFSDKDTDIIFENIYNLLRIKGLLFVQCKSINDWEYGKGEEIAPDTFKHGHIRHFFSKDYMKEKASKFEIIELYDEKVNKEDKTNHIISLIASKPQLKG